MRRPIVFSSVEPLESESGSVPNTCERSADALHRRPHGDVADAA
jgi:hypothetical protein